MEIINSNKFKKYPKMEDKEIGMGFFTIKITCKVINICLRNLKLSNNKIAFNKISNLSKLKIILKN